MVFFSLSIFTATFEAIYTAWSFFLKVCSDGWSPSIFTIILDPIILDSSTLTIACACTPFKILQSFSPQSNGFQSFRYWIKTNVSFQSLHILDWDSSWCCSPVALWTPVSSCMELFSEAQAGIDNVKMARCCSNMLRPLVSPPDVFKLLIRTDSMT